MGTRAKRTAHSGSAKVTTRLKPLARKKTAGLIKPYDAKKYAGSVPAFASVVAEEMKAWRDDR